MKKAKHLFGTDGIRGKANEFPMTVDIAMNLGKALAYLIGQGRLGHPVRENARPRVIIGKDTRLSGYCFEEAICAGLCSGGIDVLLLGPFPTPGVACVTLSMRADAGIMITASHNPFEDNGIKIFGHDGFKLSSPVEELLESLIEAERKSPDLALTFGITPEKYGKAYRSNEPLGRYNAQIKMALEKNITFDGLSVVIDAANGAAYKLAPQLFSELGAKVTVIGASPDGTNINRNVGALHPQALQEQVKMHKADIGIGLDGDADRITVVDENGDLCLSDTLLAIFAADFKMRDLLAKNTVVTTVMTNMALEQWLNGSGFFVEKTDVGDKNLVERMRSKGLNLGGESSGHFIFLDYGPSADGLLAGVLLISIMKRKGMKLSELKKIFTPYPQELINIDVIEKIPFDEMPNFKVSLQKLEQKLNNKGQLLVRYSGTESKARILVQAPNGDMAKDIAELAVKELQREIDLRRSRSN